MSITYLDQAAWNGVVMNAADIRVSALSEAVMFGRGLFETIRVVRGRPAFLPEHRARLLASCAAVGLDWKTETEVLLNRCLDVIGANALVAGALKVVVLADAEGTAELIVARDFVYPREKFQSGFTLRTHAWGGRATSGVRHKSTSYLQNLVAREAARAEGFDDALLVTADGLVVEGAATNVFAVFGDQVLTPAEESGPLPGIVRGQILRRWATRGAQTGRLTQEALAGADEIFVTNALLGVMPVAKVDAQVYQAEHYKVTRALMADYQTWLAESL